MHMMQNDDWVRGGAGAESRTVEDRPTRSRRRCPDRLGDLGRSSFKAVRKLSGNRRACRQFVALVASQTGW